MAAATPRSDQMSCADATGRDAWLLAKLRAYDPRYRRRALRPLVRAVRGDAPLSSAAPLFTNPFTPADLLAFDMTQLGELLRAHAAHTTPETLAIALAGMSHDVIDHVAGALPSADRARLRIGLTRPTARRRSAAARRALMDALFWELTYWRTPDLYEELIAGERLHPGIFRCLAPLLRDAEVLDAGAGSGRATLDCLCHGARHVYAVEPSPGLLRILQRKSAAHPAAARLTPLRGRFDAIPLPDNSVDLALSCSAFTADPSAGGDPGLAELWRVTRPGGRIVIIWPRPEDFRWLAARGFHYVALPIPSDFGVCYRAFDAAWRVARRFYARNRALLSHLARRHTPTIPFALIGPNPPHDYCWLPVEKGNDL
jgi:SAM-dependent methyltransferase